MAKNKPTRLPKRVAGMKLSKPLRKRGGQLLDFLTRPVVADLLAAALAAGVAALAENRRVRGAAVDARNRAGKAVTTAGAAVATTASEAGRQAAKALSDIGGDTPARTRSRRRRSSAERPTAH